MKRLGKTDLLVSPVGVGSADFGSSISETDSFDILDAYVAGGGNFIDTANIYGRFGVSGANESEKVIGKWLALRNPDVIVATKGAHYLPGHADVMRLEFNDVESDLDDSLLTLGLDHIDLYWLHRDDTSREIGEIIDMMEAFVRAGKIRYYGASNFSAERLTEADKYADAHGYTGFCAVSNQYNPATRNPGENTNPDPTLVITEEKELEYHRTSGKPLVPYEATARGYFSKLYSGSALPPNVARAYDNESSRNTYLEIRELAEQKGCSVQTATILTAAKAPFQVIPLTSARSITQCADIVRAIEILNDEK